jgi:hypothetical protein
MIQVSINVWANGENVITNKGGTLRSEIVSTVPGEDFFENGSMVVFGSPPLEKDTYSYTPPSIDSTAHSIRSPADRSWRSWIFAPERRRFVPT